MSAPRPRAQMARSTSRRIDRWRPLLAVAAAVAATVLVLAPTSPAAAHAVLLDASPPAGAQLDAPPSAVSVTFDEPVSWDETSLVVIDESGRRVGGAPAAEGTTLSAPVDSDEDGWFAVSWHIVSADGHPLSGAWTYRVGSGSETAPDDLLDRAAEDATPSSTARWTWTLAQWASALTAVVLLGTTFLAAVTEPVPGQRRLALVAGGAAVITALAAAAANGPQIGPNVGAFDGPASDVMLWRAGLVAAATAALAVGGAGWRRGTTTVALLAAGAGLAVATLSGHADAQGGLAVVAVAAHLVIAGCWLGAVPALLLAVGGDRDAAGRVLGAFSRAATWLLVGVLAAGVAGAVALSGGPGSVAQDWGVIMAAKLAFVAMAALAGAWNRFNVLPHVRELRPVDLRAPVLFEVVALVAIVTASVALTHNGPPRAVEALPPPAIDTGPEPIVLGAEDDAVRVTLALDPGSVGTNDVHVYVLDQLGMPAPVVDATLTLASEANGIAPIDVPLTDLGAGHLTARTDDLGIEGTWQVRLVVRPTTFTQIELAEAIEVTEPDR